MPRSGLTAPLVRDIRICVFASSIQTRYRSGRAECTLLRSLLDIKGPHCDIARLHESRRSAGITTRVLHSRVDDDRLLAYQYADYGQSQDMKSPLSLINEHQLFARNVTTSISSRRKIRGNSCLRVRYVCDEAYRRRRFRGGMIIKSRRN